MNHKVQKFNPDDQTGVLLIYDAEEHNSWATQKQIAEMFGVAVNTINEHIKAIEVELGEQFTFQLFPILASDGKTYQVKHYKREIVEMVKARIRKSGKPILYEKEILHTKVEKYLKSQQFLFIRYEVPMLIQGKADFVAYYPQQMIEYVIECKAEPFKTRHCSQVWDYAQQLAWSNEQFPENEYILIDCLPQMALAYPAEYEVSIHWEYCSRLNIQIFLIP